MIKTPAFVPVATKGTVKTMLPELLKNIKIQVAFVNTYHLVSHPGADIIEKAGGIHNYSKLGIPLMSDSGGFQVFSLARDQRKADIRGEEQPIVVKITDDGVKFRSTYDGKLIEFTPEKSMEYQKKIGADIVMAFDECTYYPSPHDYAEKAMKRTHQWLKRCIKSHPERSEGSRRSRNASLDSSSANWRTQNDKYQQYLYGIIQGATFEDLRKQSAEFVVSQNTPGVAIGGVSVGESKKEMRQQVKWISDYLPADRPVHLLGVGQFDDALDLVKYGIDTFDCVEPTRLARMGTIYQTPSSHPEADLDITKSIYKNNLESLDKNCSCYVCKNFTKSYLFHLFKQKEILGYTLATYHNLFVMERFFDRIRESIAKDLI